MKYHLTQSRRIKSTPFTSRNDLNGVSSYTVYNKTLLPTTFKDLESDYYHLKEFVQLWDVCCQKIIQFEGPDALNFLRYVSCRDLQNIKEKKCYYTPMTNSFGGLLNDTLVYFFNDQNIWVSISDSDMYMWFLGLLTNSKFNVSIFEKEIMTLAVQGPKSELLMEKFFGKQVKSLKFYNFDFFDFNNENIVVSKTGYSKQGGYEILMQNAENGCKLWDSLMSLGETYNIKAGCPNLIERVENFLLSYGNDMTINDTPYDCSLGKYCSIDLPYDFIGKKALRSYSSNERKKNLFQITFDSEKIESFENAKCYLDQHFIGNITSVVFSPVFKKYLGFIICYESDVNHKNEFIVKTKNNISSGTILRQN